MQPQPATSGGARAPDITPGTAPQRTRLPLLLALALTTLVYHSLLRNYFLTDDFLNLYNIVNTGLLEYLLTPHGGHILVTRNAIFYMCALVFGTHAEGYFTLVLLTHLCNVYLLFQVIRLFTHSPRLACFGSALWGMAPVNEGALGWYSVYGHVVVATALLWFLWRAARVADGHPLGREPVWWAIVLLVASTSFGVGIPIAMLSPVLAWLLLPPSPARSRAVKVLLILALLMPVLYLTLHRIYHTIYSTAPNLGEMLLIQLYDWRRIGGLSAYLAVYGVNALVLGVFVRWIGFPSVTAYAVAAAFAVAVVVTFARASTRTRRHLLVCLLVSAGCYGIIAAGRVLYFGVSWNAGLAAAPRYHYVAPIPLAIALCLVLARIDLWRPLPTWASTTLLLVWAGCAAAIHVRFGPRINHHPAARVEAQRVMTAIHRFAALTPAGQDVYIENQQFKGAGFVLGRMESRFPGWAALFSIYSADNTVDGKRVYFVTGNPFELAAARAGKRAATLVVAADAVDPDVVHRVPPLRPPAR